MSVGIGCVSTIKKHSFARPTVKISGSQVSMAMQNFLLDNIEDKALTRLHIPCREKMKSFAKISSEKS